MRRLPPPPPHPLAGLRSGLQSVAAVEHYALTFLQVRVMVLGWEANTICWSDWSMCMFSVSSPDNVGWWVFAVSWGLKVLGPKLFFFHIRIDTSRVLGNVPPSSNFKCGDEVGLVVAELCFTRLFCGESYVWVSCWILLLVCLIALNFHHTVRWSSSSLKSKIKDLSSTAFHEFVAMTLRPVMEPPAWQFQLPLNCPHGIGGLIFI